jgi:hypothetical protein
MISNTLKSAIALREILRPKRDEILGQWRRLRKEELYHLYTTFNFTWAIISRGRRRTVHVARMGRGEVHKKFWWGNMREGDHLEVQGVERNITLK